MDRAESVLPAGLSGNRFDVVGLGENSLDRIYVVDHWPRPGDKQSVTDCGEHPGGQVASAILGCARLGLRCAYVGAVGDDVAGRKGLEPLKRAGVNLEAVVVRVGARTRGALILVRASDGERCVLTQPDPQLGLTPALGCARTIEQSRMLHLDGTDPDLSLWAARVAEAAGVSVVLDLDQVFAGVESLLALADFPVVSRPFAEEWGGTGSPEAGLARIVSAGCRLGTVTCGKTGAIAQWPDGGPTRSAGFDVSVQDTIGAGDAFHAGFIWALLQGQAVDEVLRTANAVAALSCTALGAQEGLPNAQGLAAFLDAAEPDSFKV